jgi:FkbM family methyltransferase
LDPYGWEWWLRGCYPRSGRLFLDIGANVGQWTRTLAAGYDRVVALEPNPTACTQLEQDLPENVEVIRKAAWSTAGLRTLHLFASTLHASFVRDDTDQHLQVETVTVDSLNLEHVDFIKIDTEGGEYEILKGAEKTLRRFHPRLLIEIHSREEGELVLQSLKNLDYRIAVIRDPYHAVGSELWLGHFWISANGQHL